MMIVRLRGSAALNRGQIIPVRCKQRRPSRLLHMPLCLIRAFSTVSQGMPTVPCVYLIQGFHQWVRMTGLSVCSQSEKTSLLTIFGL